MDAKERTLEAAKCAWRLAALAVGHGGRTNSPEVQAAAEAAVDADMARLRSLSPEAADWVAARACERMEDDLAHFRQNRRATLRRGGACVLSMAEGTVVGRPE